LDLNLKVEEKSQPQFVSNRRHIDQFLSEFFSGSPLPGQSGAEVVKLFFFVADTQLKISKVCNCKVLSKLIQLFNNKAGRLNPNIRSNILLTRKKLGNN
jgi:hypothetical protein